MEQVNIIVCLHQRHDDNYVRAFAAMYASIRTHTSASLSLYIIHDDTVSKKNLELLSDYIGKEDLITFIDINNYPNIANISKDCDTGNYSPAIIWRVFLTDLCPVNKVILLDVDLIFLCDIGTIWNNNIDNFSISASLRRKPWSDEYHRLIETPLKKYFRIGVALINLNSMRENSYFIKNREHFLINKLPEINKITNLPEQSLFNHFFHDTNKPLDINLLGTMFSNDNSKILFERLEKMEKMEKIIIDVKGWNSNSPFVYFYWSYLLMTPWSKEAYDWLYKNISYPKRVK